MHMCVFKQYMQCFVPNAIFGYYQTTKKKDIYQYYFCECVFLKRGLLYEGNTNVPYIQYNTSLIIDKIFGEL